MNEEVFAMWIHIPPELMAVIIVVTIWSSIWKAIAMWKSARNNQIVWFVCVLIFNTVGLLEIIYLAFFQRDRNDSKPVVVEEKKSIKKKK